MPVDRRIKGSVKAAGQQQGWAHLHSDIVLNRLCIRRLRTACPQFEAHRVWLTSATDSWIYSRDVSSAANAAMHQAVQLHM